MQKNIFMDRIRERLKKIIKNQVAYLDEEVLQEEENVFELIGYDSLTVIELLTEIEKEFDIVFDYSFDFNKYNSLNSISEYIYSRIKEDEK